MGNNSLSIITPKVIYPTCFLFFKFYIKNVKILQKKAKKYLKNMQETLKKTCKKHAKNMQKIAKNCAKNSQILHKKTTKIN